MYDVIFLSANFEIEYRCQVVDFYWHSKWYEPGEFQIQVLADNDLDLNICKYVATNTKREIGIIGRWQYTSDDMQTVLISGYFYEQELFEHCLYPTYSASGKDVWQISKEICETYLDELGFDFSVSSKPADGVISPDSLAVSFQQTGDYVGTALYALASVYGYGVGVTQTESGIDIGILNYHDRTGDGVDEEVVLSVSFNNIKSYDVIHDESVFKNMAIIAGEGEGSARVFEVIDISDTSSIYKVPFFTSLGENFFTADNERFYVGLQRKRALWVDARDLQQEEGETIADYRLRLRQRGLEQLAEHVIIDNVEVAIREDDAERIGTEFNIGDMVSVTINPLKLYYKMKIIEVEDVFNKGKRTVSLIFGNKIPTSWEKVRSLYR